MGGPFEHASERQVEGETCAEVVDALALVIALAIDPAVSTAPPPSSAPSPALLPTPAPPSEPAPPEATPPPSPVSEPPPPAPLRDRAPAQSPAASFGLRPTVGASFVTFTGLAPDPLAGAAVFTELESDSPRLLAPSVRVTATGAANGAFESAPASIVLAALRADGCPARIRSGPGSIRACLAVDTGLLRAEGGDVARPLPATRFWLDLAALARARWSLPGRFFVEVDGGLTLPVTRPTFVYYTPFVVVHEVPVLAATASVGAGLRFR